MTKKASVMKLVVPSRFQVWRKQQLKQQQLQKWGCEAPRLYSSKLLSCLAPHRNPYRARKFQLFPVRYCASDAAFALRTCP
jgi:hypothetical protein